MSLNAGNVFIQIKPLGERQENVTTQRKPLKATQNDAHHKENYNEKLKSLKAASSATFTQKALIIAKIDAQTQVDVAGSVSVEDLTSDNDAGANYYKHLAEQRREALKKTLLENQHLSERIESLEEELDTSRKELDEAVQLTEILKEFLIEDEENNDVESDAEK